MGKVRLHWMDPAVMLEDSVGKLPDFILYKYENLSYVQTYPIGKKKNKISPLVA